MPYEMTRFKSRLENFKYSPASKPGNKELVWDPSNVIRWIRMCRADKGSPRFVRFGDELESRGSILAVCWGGYNKEVAKTVRFIGIKKDPDAMRLLLDENKKDWIQLIRKYGSEQTRVELLHTDNEGTIDLRLKCEECEECPVCPK